jgi:hypothetical protein
MFKSSFADPAKLKNLIVIFLWMPQIQLQEAMGLAKYSIKEIADIAFRGLLQRALPGGSIKGLRAHVARDVPPLPAPPDCTKQCQHRANPYAIVGIERTPSVHHSSSPNKTGAPDIISITPSPALLHQPAADNVMPAKTLTSSVKTKTNKCKLYNRNCYLKNRHVS